MNSHSSPMMGKRSRFCLISGFGNLSEELGRGYIAGWVAIWFSAVAVSVTGLYGIHLQNK